VNIESQLKDRILAECDKLIERHHAYHNHLHQEWLRTHRRTAGVPAKQVMKPEHWDLDLKFNPFYVRRNAAAIARSVAKKIANLTCPLQPYQSVGERSKGLQVN
jgi:hypothetical protein